MKNYSLKDFFDRYPVLTADGSHTFALRGAGEHYHSLHGAMNESLHVFIREGFEVSVSDRTSIDILEIGFGTGLNALLSLKSALEKSVSVEYNAVEPYPLNASEAKLLNFPSLLGNGRLLKAFTSMHSAGGSEPVEIDSLFVFRKIISTLEELTLPESSFDLIYHDAFAPWLQPALWSRDSFEKLYRAVRPGGTLVTYSAKGSVKRILSSCGFTIENPPGPAGKREMTRATKNL